MTSISTSAPWCATTRLLTTISSEEPNAIAAVDVVAVAVRDNLEALRLEGRFRKCEMSMVVVKIK